MIYYLEKGISIAFNMTSFGRGDIILLIWCFVVGGIIINVLYGIAKIIANSCSPKKTIKTQVVYKNIVETTQYNNNMPTGTSYEYYITFESETQKQFKMEVLRKIYDSILMGDVGILVRKGSRFIAFHCLDTKGEQQISI